MRAAAAIIILGLLASACTALTKRHDDGLGDAYLGVRCVQAKTC